MGYGFVEYKKRSDALKAIKELQVLQGSWLYLKSINSIMRTLKDNSWVSLLEKLKLYQSCFLWDQVSVMKDVPLSVLEECPYCKSVSTKMFDSS